MSAPGRFLTIEGVDGAGKSSQLPMLDRHLRQSGTRTLVTREPGGTPLGESLREALLDPRFTGMAPVAELLIMFAARAEHLEKVIAPALADGVWVLCERFTDATFAYQGGGRMVDPARIAALEQAVQGELRPDLVLVLDLPVEVGLERIAWRRAVDRFEREDIEFFRRIREVYLERARMQPARYAVIEASADRETVAGRLIETISERLA